jgi:phospholipase/carboxylesterase
MLQKQNDILDFYAAEKPEKVTQLAILIHGYGASGSDLINIAPHFSKVKNTQFVAPCAPFQSHFGPDSHQWFPLETYEEEYLLKGMNKAIPYLEKFIAKQQKIHKLSNAETILIGFSQGTMLAIHFGIREKNPIKTIIGFSGGSLANRIAIELKSKPAICLIHGEDDYVLPPHYSTETAQALKKNDVTTELHLLANLGHSIDPRCIKLAQDFIMQN